VSRKGFIGRCYGVWRRRWQTVILRSAQDDSLLATRQTVFSVALYLETV
jgi:hypothetical protein